MDFWQHRGIINADMESAVLFVLGSLYHIPTANSLVVHLNRKTYNWEKSQNYNYLHKKAADSVMEALIG